LALGALIAAFAALGIAAPGATAAYEVTNVVAGPASDQAGANSDFSISFDLSGGQAKDLVIHLPPGLVGNPLATATCTEQQLTADACPAASAVGTITNDVTSVGGVLPLTANGTIYNVVPRQGEPARFGFVLSAPPADKIVLQSPASLRPSDFGLDTTLTNLPQNATVLGLPVGITITAVQLTLKGQVGTPAKGFLRNPTSCGTHTVGIDATDYAGEAGHGEDTFDTTNCAALPFSPQFSAEITQSGPLSKPVEVSTSIKQTIAEAGLKRAVVTLPPELGPNGTAFSNTCAEADFQAGNCPAASIVGSARAASPLQSEPLTGPVALLTPPIGGLPILGLDLRGALALKLEGAIGLDATNVDALRNQVTFDGLPDIPISDFTLTFDGGTGGLNLATRDACTPPAFGFDTTFDSHSGLTTSGETNAKATCKGSGGKRPRARVKLKAPKSGDPVLALKLHAGAAPLKSAALRLPKGVSFSHGKKLRSGTSVKADGNGLKGKALKVSGRGLRLRLGKGATNVKARFDDGAVSLAGRKAPGKFSLVLRDVDGVRTKLSVQSK
jgi:hypothetical protein